MVFISRALLREYSLYSNTTLRGRRKLYKEHSLARTRLIKAFLLGGRKHPQTDWEFSIHKNNPVSITFTCWVFTYFYND